MNRPDGKLPSFFDQDHCHIFSPSPQTFCNAFAYFFVVACLLVELVYVLMVAPHPRSFFHRQSMGIYFICIIYNLLLVSLYFRSKPSSFGCCICISSCSLYAMQLDNSNAICIGNVTIISLRYIATKSMINPACQYFFLHRHRFPRPFFTSLSQVCISFGIIIDAIESAKRKREKRKLQKIAHRCRNFAYIPVTELNLLHGQLESNDGERWK